ncbi:MAG: alpha/beta fold hydrolase [Pseudomonadales bacterium]
MADIPTRLQAVLTAAAARGNDLPGIRQRLVAGDWLIRFETDGGAVGLGNRSGRLSVLPDDTGTASVRLAATDVDWKKFLADVPVPGYQTLHAMVMTGVLRLSGDTLTYHRHLLALEILLDRLKLPESSVTVGTAPAVVEPITGRYLNLTLEGAPKRIYFEEAGQGIPLLCLHTAGADGRQYRGLLNDAEVTDRFRVIAFDLPRHGKSSFAPGHPGEAYVLTTERYVRTVMAVVEALALERPVVMGCSIGGRAVLHLALAHGHRFRGAIGLQSALHADSGGEDMSGGSASPLFRPDTHGAEIGAAWVAGITAPDSPPAERWETLWYYMQGGPGVFLGDLYYYFVDGDLRNRVTAREAADACPLYLLSGEYDLSATPAMAAEVAELFGARHFEVMQGLGHFPMSEDYGQFRRYLLPVLDQIEKDQLSL